MYAISETLDPELKLKERVREFYEDYHQRRDREPDDLLKDHYSTRFQGRVLEVEPGRRIPHELPGSATSYTAIDISLHAVQRASEDRISAAVADAEHLPFATGGFDAVACCDVLEHTVDPSAVLREMRRASSGTIIEMGSNYLGTEYMPGLDRHIPARILKCLRGEHRIPRRLEAHLSFGEDWRPDEDAVSACNAWWVSDQMRRNGFEIVTLDTCSFFNLRVLNRIPPLHYHGPCQSIVGGWRLLVGPRRGTRTASVPSLRKEDRP